MHVLFGIVRKWEFFKDDYKIAITAETLTSAPPPRRNTVFGNLRQWNFFKEWCIWEHLKLRMLITDFVENLIFNDNSTSPPLLKIYKSISYMVKNFWLVVNMSAFEVLRDGVLQNCDFETLVITYTILRPKIFNWWCIWVHFECIWIHIVCLITEF